MPPADSVYGPQYGRKYGPKSGVNNTGWATPGFPATLAELNAVFAAQGATFSHAWNFEASSGNEADYATSGAIALVPAGTAPTQGVVTGLSNGDKGVQFGDNTSSRMEAGSSSDLDVTTGNFWMLGTTRLLLSTSGRALVAKYNGTVFYRLVTTGTGQIQFGLSDTVGGATTIAAAADHSGTAYFDWIAGRCDGECRIITNLADSGTTATSTASLTNTGRFSAGRNFGTASSIHTFLAWGTNPVDCDLFDEMLAAWRAYRGA